MEISQSAQNLVCIRNYNAHELFEKIGDHVRKALRFFLMPSLAATLCQFWDTWGTKALLASHDPVGLQYIFQLRVNFIPL